MLFILLVLGMLLVAEGKVDDSCGKELIKVVSCIAYVQNKASYPSQECCIQLQVVRDEAPVCLCELVTSAGSGVNLTSLITLPRLCQVDAKVSDCPALLAAAKTPSQSSKKLSTAQTVTFIILALQTLLLLNHLREEP